MPKIDITSRLERFTAFENRLGVDFKGLSAYLDDENDDYLIVNVCGEINATTGTKIESDITVVIAVYDKSERVIGTAEFTYYEDNFFGFDTFNECISISVNNISKIKIYPKNG